MHPNTLQYRIEAFAGASSALVLCELPPATDFFVIHKRVAISTLHRTQSEENICICIVCIGEGGIPLQDGFERCHVMAGVVRDWITKLQKNAGNVIAANKEPLVICTQENDDAVLYTQEEDESVAEMTGVGNDLIYESAAEE